MTIRLKLLQPDGDSHREFVFDRAEISIGEGLFNDIVLEDVHGIGIYGVIDTEEGALFHSRPHGVPARYFRAGELFDETEADESASWSLDEGDRLELGGETSFQLEVLRHEEEGGSCVEAHSLQSFENADLDPELHRHIWTLADALSREPTVEGLLRGTVALLAAHTDRPPLRTSLACLDHEGRLADHVHVFEPDADGGSLSLESAHSMAPLTHPGTYTRQSTPLLGLGAERHRMREIVQAGDALAVYPSGRGDLGILYPIGGDARGVLDIEWESETREPLIERMGRLGRQLAPVLRLVLDRLARASQHAGLVEENRYFRECQRRQYLLKDLVCESEAMQQVYETLESWTSNDAPVLLVGEAGSGKSLLARALHHASTEQRDSFLRLDCRTLSEEVLNVELFGCTECRLPDATGPRKGVFELARGGTVFLDEIDHLSTSLQAKIVRVLNEREVRRLGEAVGRRVQTRLIASTHRDLKPLVDEGSFRRDLYLRLQERGLDVPPLREREADVMPLAHSFLETFAERYDRPCRRFDREARKLLQEHEWSGNVRELKTVVESAVLNASGVEHLTAEHLAL